jgi:hypothetical protein
MQGTIDLSGEAHRPFLVERQTIHHRACLRIKRFSENLVFLYCPFEAETVIVSPLGYRRDYSLPFSVLRRSTPICITHLMRYELGCVHLCSINDIITSAHYYLSYFRTRIH